ncbi:hypothetical protein CANARDRAFT_175789 [[Candida] arabinofermentans NRRL YB-2248]|uniref:Replication factor A protein 3 n=1 Tax=[Candida] arabinofermentans NRRL YB-2248 TaxID=983967 RepID=A0A1E4T2T0_9ASCO|nr:hypothetical protein CANARDRAFT_175789 [[Candida] arabinofermentans NRRL YB-2248]
MESIRVDATLLQQFKRKTVRIIGKLISKSSNNAILNSNGNVELKFTHQNQLLDSLIIDHWYECIGMVDDDDLSIKVIQCIDFGTEINEKAVLKVVELSHKVPELFYTT